jgi:hypothetical protein
MIQLELPLTTPNYAVLNDKDKILQYRLIVLRAGVKLEALGGKKRGTSCTAEVKKMLGLSRNTPRTELIEALDALINTFQTK